MKKIILLFALTLVVLSCKPRGEEPKDAQKKETKDSTAVSTCLNLDNYRRLTILKEKVKWLQDYGDAVCDDTLYNAVLKDHKLKTGDRVTQQATKFIVRWGDLKKFLGANVYNCYVSFITTDEDIEQLIMVPNYGDAKYCFSIPLLKSLGKKYAEKDDDVEFKFSFANIKPSERVVVIQVGGGSFYDYSTDPKIVPYDNKPL